MQIYADELDGSDLALAEEELTASSAEPENMQTLSHVG